MFSITGPNTNKFYMYVLGGITLGVAFSIYSKNSTSKTIGYGFLGATAGFLGMIVSNKIEQKKLYNEQVAASVQKPDK